MRAVRVVPADIRSRDSPVVVRGANGIPDTPMEISRRAPIDAFIGSLVVSGNFREPAAYRHHCSRPPALA